jgi:hypothetical protein
MRYLIYTLAAALVLVMSACTSAPSPAQPVLPTFVTQPEAAIPVPNESYPTAQAQETNASQTVSGFSLRLEKAWRDGKEVHADVCFDLPDSSDWTIWAAHFEYGGTSVSEFSSALISKNDGTAEQPAERCDELTFYVPPDADLSSAAVGVESIGAYPTPDEYCGLYMPKIQEALQQRGIAITLDCSEVNGVKNLQISSKPADMSETEAEQLVFSDEFYTIKGPWTFSASFGP